MDIPEALSVFVQPIKLALERGREDAQLLSRIVDSLRHLTQQRLKIAQTDAVHQKLTQLQKCLADENPLAAIEACAVTLGISSEPSVDKSHPIKETSHTANQTAPPIAPKPPVATPARRISSDTLLKFLPGIGPARAALFSRLGLTDVDDLLSHYPRSHIDRTVIHAINQLPSEGEATVLGHIRSVELKRPRPRLTLFIANLSDGTGFVPLNFWNQAYLAKMLVPSMMILATGKVEWFHGKPKITVTEWEELDDSFESKDSPHVGRLVPIYPATEKLNQKVIREAVWRARTVALSKKETLPAKMIERHGLIGLGDAVWQRHFPSSREQLAKAEERLAFDALLGLELELARRRRVYRAGGATPLESPDIVTKLLQEFGHQLTNSQQKAWQEIATDITNSAPMCRMLQGDVGSGKTVIAALALAVCAACGGQAALMAPTEVLAEQHMQTLSRLLTPIGFPPYLLTGSSNTRSRDEVRAALGAQKGLVIVGTHALLTESVEFNALELVIIDEQHRFGVMQRGTLENKGKRPHLLVMTATPIPRTLAIALYGDLDISVLDEMPPGRTPIITEHYQHTQVKKAYELVRREVMAGRQAFLVYPLVEESEKLKESQNLELKAATKMFEHLSREVFVDYQLGLLHGRMSAAEKDAVMTDFRAGKTQILVSTTVIEVGIDVPNASVMLIEHAERFGLSQLHQLRGRVGRGKHQSWCLLVSGPQLGMEGRARLEAMVKTSDGFEISRIDLAQRGAGELAGVRQHGIPDMALLALASHPQLLSIAQEEALLVLEKDPELRLPENAGLHEMLEQRKRGALVSAHIV